MCLNDDRYNYYRKECKFQNGQQDTDRLCSSKCLMFTNHQYELEVIVELKFNRR